MKRIADYDLLERIGQGNHGVFYRARTPPRLGIADPFCAVKILEQRAGDDEFRRMANELQLFASAHSPHLVALFDAGHQRGTLYYATRWHPLGSLGQSARPLTVADKIAAVVDAARGAHALHEVGVAHRDIKPGNVLLTERPSTGASAGDGVGGVLADLGLAQLLSPGVSVTGTGPIGSIEFMEPGVVRGERAGRASDIWSLGVTLHVALTGEGVFGRLPDRNLLGALRHVLETEPRIDPTLPPSLAEVIRSCLAPERADRPSTALAVAERLGASVPA